MPKTSSNHSHVVFIGHVDGSLIVLGASGVNDSGNAILGGELDAVRKWKECFRRHHGTFEGKIKFIGFIYRLFQGIDAGSLPTTHTDKRAVFYQGYCI